MKSDVKIAQADFHLWWSRLFMFLPSAVRVVADAQEKGLVGLDIRGAWATILVLGASLIMLFKSNWLASL
jgi:hypothetical protein